MDIDKVYREVTDLVLRGLSITEAVKRAGWSNKYFYSKLSPQQKLELQYTKTLNTIYGKGSQYKMTDPLLTTSFPINKEYNYLEDY